MKAEKNLKMVLGESLKSLNRLDISIGKSLDMLKAASVWTIFLMVEVVI